MGNYLSLNNCPGNYLSLNYGDLSPKAIPYVGLQSIMILELGPTVRLLML